MSESPVCAWPARLSHEVDDRGARFRQEWQVFADGYVPLPGDARRTPEGVTVGGGAGAGAPGVGDVGDGVGAGLGEPPPQVALVSASTNADARRPTTSSLSLASMLFDGERLIREVLGRNGTGKSLRSRPSIEPGAAVRLNERGLARRSPPLIGERRRYHVLKLDSILVAIGERVRCLRIDRRSA